MGLVLWRLQNRFSALVILMSFCTLAERQEHGLSPQHQPPVVACNEILDIAVIPRIGIFAETFLKMAKNTSILLGDYFEKFIAKQVETGKYSSASEVVRAALRLFEKEQNQKKEL